MLEMLEMKKMYKVLIAFTMATLIISGCSTTVENEVILPEPTPEVNLTVEEPLDFSLVGAIDCRGVRPEGGEVRLKAKIQYDDRILRDSFTYSYSIEDTVVDFETPIVNMTADGSSYLLEGDMYIYANESNMDIIHVFDLTYLDGGLTRLYRGGCQQGKYVTVNEIIFVEVVDTNDTNTTP